LNILRLFPRSIVLPRVNEVDGPAPRLNTVRRHSLLDRTVCGRQPASYCCILTEREREKRKKERVGKANPSRKTSAVTDVHNDRWQRSAAHNVLHAVSRLPCYVFIHRRIPPVHRAAHCF